MFRVGHELSIKHLGARPRGYKTFFMLNLTEHESSTAQKTPANKVVSCDVVFIMLTIDDILTFMSRINFVLS